MSRFWVCVLLLTVGLAACGGGGSSTSPIPIASNPPATTYTSQLIFVGQLAGTIQSGLRRAQMAQPMTSGTRIPIMLVSSTGNNALGSSSPASAYGGWVQAVVSPMPSASPSVAFSNTDTAAAFQTPAPGTSPQPLPSGVIAQQQIGSSGANAQAAGVASASISSPVNQTPTNNVYTYMAISLECQTPPDQGSGIGATWQNGQWATMAGPGDVYLTCGSTPALNIPGGFVTVSSDTPYSSLTASQWSNVQTSLPLSTLATLNADGSNNAEIIGKTSGGAIFKLYPNVLDTYPGEYSGAVEVSGAGVDGF